MTFTTPQAIVVSPTDEEAFVTLGVTRGCTGQLITEAALAHNPALREHDLTPLHQLFADLFNSDAPLALRGGAARTLMAKHHFDAMVTCPVNDLDLLLYASNPGDIHTAICHHGGSILAHEQLGNDLVNIKFVLAGVLCDLTVATTRVEFDRCCQHVYPGNMIIPLNFKTSYPKRLLDDLRKRQISFGFGISTTLDQLIRARRMEVYETLAIVSPPDATALSEHTDTDIQYIRLELKKGLSRGKGKEFLLELIKTRLLYHFFPSLAETQNNPLLTQLIWSMNNIDILGDTEKNSSLRVYALFIALHAKLTDLDPHDDFDATKTAMPWLIPSWLEKRDSVHSNIAWFYNGFQAAQTLAASANTGDGESTTSSTHGSSSTDSDDSVAETATTATGNDESSDPGAISPRTASINAADEETTPIRTPSASDDSVVAVGSVVVSTPPAPATPPVSDGEEHPLPTPKTQPRRRRRGRGHLKPAAEVETPPQPLQPTTATTAASSTSSWWPSISLPSLPTLPDFTSWWSTPKVPQQSKRARRILAKKARVKAGLPPTRSKTRTRTRTRTPATRTLTRTSVDSGTDAANWTRFFPDIDKMALATAGVFTVMTGAAWYQLRNDGALHDVAFDELFTQAVNFIATQAAELPWHMHLAYVAIIVTSVIQCIKGTPAEAETTAPVAARV